MADEYPDGPFVQNALVFAPGKTIIESSAGDCRHPVSTGFSQSPHAQALRSRSSSSPSPATATRICPGVVWGSRFNVVVTNTEKIRIQKSNGPQRQPTVSWLAARDRATGTRKSPICACRQSLRCRTWPSSPTRPITPIRPEVARASGRRTRRPGEREFKDRRHQEGPPAPSTTWRSETSLSVVVNTTGTPYFERQPLRDVVVWYGLGRGHPRRHPQGGREQHPGLRSRWRRQSTGLGSTRIVQDFRRCTTGRSVHDMTARRRASRCISPRPRRWTRLSHLSWNPRWRYTASTRPRCSPVHRQCTGGNQAGFVLIVWPTTPARRIPGHPARQHGHRGLELSQPFRHRAGAQAQNQQQFCASGRHALPAPGARR